MLASVLIVLLKRKLVVCGVGGGFAVHLELKVFIAKANCALGCDEDITEKNVSAKQAGPQMSTF